MSMGHTCEFLGVYISYTSLTFHPVYFLPTIYATYSLYLSPLSLPPTPLLDAFTLRVPQPEGGL